MRILGIDYGEKRIGIAITDEMEITARPLAAIHRRNRLHDAKELEKIIHEYGVEMIVMGYPVSLDGSEGLACEKVNRFIHRLENVFPLKVVRQDEMLSTREAEEILHGTRKSIKERRNMVDSLAACLILERYLESRSRREPAHRS